MKKTILVVALAMVLVLAFASTALATSGKFYNYNSDYYSWGSYAGSGIVPGSVITTPGGTFTVSGSPVAANFLYNIGANPTNPGVHGNYQATTAKCGICHSVHRANATGTKLLNTGVATCAGCHRAGASTVTNVLVSWQTGGPHSSGNSLGCTDRACHINNPHGANGSQYKIFASKLITAAADAQIADAVADSAASGITVNDLNADVSSTWSAGTRDAVISGYTCNVEGCHEQSQLTVLQKGWAQQRELIYPDGNVPGNQALKTGHLSVAVANNAAGSYAPVNSCTSCHDKTDSATRTGYDFPHSQTAYGTSNTPARSFLWMTMKSGTASTDTTGLADGNAKAMDGNCLKCHRTNAPSVPGAEGIGINH